MGSILLITGGVRSGKSALALQRAKAYGKVAYIATAIAADGEMEYRIQRHKMERPAHFVTFETTEKIPELLGDDKYDCFLLDCLTNFISAQMLSLENWEEADMEQRIQQQEAILKEIKRLLEAGKNARGDLIIVTNEVGMGLVPETALGRDFRDIVGKANQIAAAAADTAILMASGIPIPLKGGRQI